VKANAEPTMSAQTVMTDITWRLRIFDLLTQL
jgi:hypothetical protein